MDTRHVNLEALEEPYAALRAVCPRSEARLLVSMQAHGQKTPLFVREGSGPGCYAVLDGHKRLRALRRLKMDVAEAEVWSLPSAEALVRAYRLHQGAWNALEEGALIEELHRTAHWSLRRIAEELERTEGWASRRLGLVRDLPAPALWAVRQGKLGVYSAVKYVLPLARAKGAVAESLALKLAEGSFTTREVGLLYVHCLKGTAPVVERILADPATFLRALEVPKGDIRLSASQNKCLDHLNLIGKIALGVMRQLPEAWPVASDEPAYTLFVKAWRMCRERFVYLEKTVLLQEGAGSPQASSREILHA